MYMDSTSLRMNMRNSAIIWMELTVNNTSTQESKETKQTDNFYVLTHSFLENPLCFSNFTTSSNLSSIPVL